MQNVRRRNKLLLSTDGRTVPDLAVPLDRECIERRQNDQTTSFGDWHQPATLVPLYQCVAITIENGVIRQRFEECPSRGDAIRLAPQHRVAKMLVVTSAATVAVIA